MLNAFRLVMTTSMGYFQVINFAHAVTTKEGQQSVQRLSVETPRVSRLSWVNIPQYAVLRPTHFPRKGTATMLISSSICLRLSCHSSSASPSSSLSLPSSDIDDSAESWDGVAGGISIMDDRLAEREAVEESREPSGVGYSEESEEKECSDMAGRKMS